MREPSPPPLDGIDDLFKKTKATPPLYWLPNTAAVVAKKLALVAADKAGRGRRGWRG